MLVEAQERFAARTAQWMMADKTLKGEELIKRLSLFPDDYAVMVSKESLKLKKKAS